MSLKYVQYCSDSRLSCTGCLPADVIACVRPEIVAPQLLCNQGLDESAYSFSYIEATVVAVSKDKYTNKYKYTLEYESEQIVVGVLEVVPSDITGVFCKGCLTSWVEQKVGNEVYITENEEGETVLVSQHGCPYVLPNADGNSAYVYIGYASDDIGSDFTLVPDGTSTHINFLNTSTVLAPPVLADFDPSDWTSYVGPQGIAGPVGPQGLPGDDAYVYIAYASDSSGSDFTLTPDGTSTFVNFLSTNSVLTPPVIGDFDPANWAQFVGPTGATGATGGVGPVGPAGPAGSGGSAPVGNIILGFWQVAPTDHLPMEGDTIGDVGSGADFESNDYAGLFEYLWDNLADAQAPVSTGRGASAAADFAAGKTILILDTTGTSPLAQTLSGVGSTLGGTFGAVEHSHTVPPHYHSMTANGANLNITSSGNHTTAITHSHTPFNTASGGQHGHVGITDEAVSTNFPARANSTPGNINRVMRASTTGSDNDTVQSYFPHFHQVTIANGPIAGLHTHTIIVPTFTGNSASNGAHTHTSGNFAGSIGLVDGGANGDASFNSGNSSHACFSVKYYIRYQ